MAVWTVCVRSMACHRAAASSLCAALCNRTCRPGVRLPWLRAGGGASSRGRARRVQMWQSACARAHSGRANVRFDVGARVQVRHGDLGLLPAAARRARPPVARARRGARRGRWRCRPRLPVRPRWPGTRGTLAHAARVREKLAGLQEDLAMPQTLCAAGRTDCCCQTLCAESLQPVVASRGEEHIILHGVAAPAVRRPHTCGHGRPYRKAGPFAYRTCMSCTWQSR